MKLKLDCRNTENFQNEWLIYIKNNLEEKRMKETCRTKGAAHFQTVGRASISWVRPSLPSGPAASEWHSYRSLCRQRREMKLKKGWKVRVHGWPMGSDPLWSLTSWSWLLEYLAPQWACGVSSTRSALYVQPAAVGPAPSLRWQGCGLSVWSTSEGRFLFINQSWTHCWVNCSRRWE